MGKKTKTTKKINMEWRGSLHSLRGGPERGHRVLPPRDVLGHTKGRRAAGRASRLAQATSTRLSFALLKKWVVGLVLEGKGGETKSERVRTNSPGRMVLVQNEHPSKSRLARLPSARTHPACQRGRRGPRPRRRTVGCGWSGGGQMTCCC